MPRALRSTLTDDQVARLLRTPDRRDRALVAFLLDTGARAHEAAGVRRRHIAERLTAAGERRYAVTLYGADGHSKTGARAVPLSWPAARLLTGIGHGDLIWTSQRLGSDHEPLTTDGLKRAVRRATAARLGTAYGPHALRHTMATMYIRAGGDLESLRRILGHTDIRTTAQYLHLLTDDLDEKHAAFSPIARAVQL